MKKSHKYLQQTLCVLSMLLGFIPLTYAKDVQVDSIVYGDYVVTMMPEQAVIKDGAVAVLGNNIVAVGSRTAIDKKYSTKQKILGTGRILMPGLINGHTHSPMTLLRGFADDLDLMTWLQDYIFPVESTVVNEDFIKVGSELACWEMIRSGTTTFVDMYFYANVTAKVVQSCGLRAIITGVALDFPIPGSTGWDQSFNDAVAFVEQWQGKHERITPGFGPHAPYTVSPEHLKQIAASAQKMSVPLSIHVAESAAETDIIQARYKSTPVKHIVDLGLARGNLIAAHMVHPNVDEINMLVEHNVGVIHNPTSNLKLASGIAPISQMLAQGVRIGLGTDGAASNNDLDLWEEMRLSALIHKVEMKDPTVIPALTALKMATSMGADAIGLGDVTGQLVAGKRADMIQVSFDSPRLAPMYDVVSHLVYAIDASDVVTSMVSGKLLMQAGKVLTLDGKRVKAAAHAKSEVIRQSIKQ
ncbi:5-methylthioadenosine/S-adenosylhomocysteine deaminase [Colwellia chukchiensis]|uniref:5-methylthioadenosine/S-adenosylhomocysteine deaminase n=1 Tax=Colwellia chukchiensis TaxID=641665 RepID=A0A1H7M4B2_9GAMM|nr:amidohydrolase family protein [Colwellia chukchiensis]SEL05808.1 5-methylthioadenosine/S-adenosylhomocysteine deaminase [Colwellia chukchiensis]